MDRALSLMLDGGPLVSRRTKICRRPFTFAVKATDLRSGEMDGDSSRPGKSVTRRTLGTVIEFCAGAARLPREIAEQHNGRDAQESQPHERGCLPPDATSRSRRRRGPACVRQVLEIEDEIPGRSGIGPAAPSPGSGGQGGPAHHGRGSSS